MDADILVRQVSSAVGEVQENFLSKEQLRTADAVIDRHLAGASPAEQLSGSMAKAFLRLPFEDGPIAEPFARFVAADYEVSNDKVDLNGLRATADHRITAGKLPSDMWSASRVIADSLSQSSPYRGVAEQTGRQMAMLLFGCEKVVCHQAQPFDVLAQEFEKHGIAPFENIRMLEFAADRYSTLANTKRGLARLLGSYQLHAGAGEGKARRGNTGFVSDDAAPGLPERGSVNCVVTRNIFNRGAVEKDIDPYKNAQNLLRIFSNLLPDTGRLYISTSLSDPIVLRDIPELLRLTGFRPVGEPDYCHEGRTPSYVLERDYRIRGPEAVTSVQMAEFPSQRLQELSEARTGVLRTGGSPAP